MQELPEVFSNFINYMSATKGKSKNTINGYTCDLVMFMKFLKKRQGLVKDTDDFDNIKVVDITPEILNKVTLNDLYAYLSYVEKERHVKECGRARKVASLRTFFKYMKSKANIINQNPALELETPKIPDRLPKVLSLEESQTLLHSVKEGKHKERDYCIITLFLNCGIRLSELVGINLNSIKSNSLHVIGKGNKERSIPLNKACMDAINEYMRVRGAPTNKEDLNALFLSELQKRDSVKRIRTKRQRISKSEVQKIVKKYIIQAGLDPQRYSTHKLRHTAATLMYKYGKTDIRTLKDLLGHKDITTTEIYTHLDNEQLREATNSNPLANFK